MEFKYFLKRFMGIFQGLAVLISLLGLFFYFDKNENQNNFIDEDFDEKKISQNGEKFSNENKATRNLASLSTTDANATSSKNNSSGLNSNSNSNNSTSNSDDREVSETSSENQQSELRNSYSSLSGYGSVIQDLTSNQAVFYNPDALNNSSSSENVDPLNEYINYGTSARASDDTEESDEANEAEEVDSLESFTNTWNFSVGTESDFTLSSGFIEIDEDVVRLAARDFLDDENDPGFGQGSKSGIEWDQANLVLRLDQASAIGNNSELDISWTPKWENLIGYWKFDGNANDSSGNSLHGTFSGSASATGVAKIGSASGSFSGGEFDLSAKYTELNNAITSNTTVSFWIRLSSLGAGDVSLFSFKTDNHGFAALFDSTAYFMVCTSNIAPCVYYSGNFLTLNQWIHVAIVKQGTLVDPIVYINGDRKTLANSGSGLVTTNKIGGGDYSNITGEIDDFALWETNLTEAEILTIYERQSAKYSGIFKSRIMNGLDDNATWESLSWLTTLPFYKSLPDYTSGAIQNETATDYTQLVGSTETVGDNNLMTGILGLWHFDNSNADTSGNSRNFTLTGNATYSDQAKLGTKSLKLDGSGDYGLLSLNSFTSANLAKGTISAWVKLNELPAAGTGYSIFDVEGYLGDQIFNTAGVTKFKYRMYDGAIRSAVGTTVIVKDQWYHYVQTWDGSTIRLYVNGQQEASGVAGVPNPNFSNRDSRIGDACDVCPDQPLNGYIDEVAVWGRDLKPDEIFQLYRRGSNRLKFQVRNCVNADCSDDPSEESWKGPDGTNLTYFSEKFNTATQAATPSGVVLKDSPVMTFSNFTAAVDTLKYFQYRTILESDDNSTNCDYGSGATWCSPEVLSVFLPPEDLDTSYPTVINSEGVNFVTLASFEETLSSEGCSGGSFYSLSNDSSTWYWWDGSSWTSADGTASQANSASDVNANIGTFATAVGEGELFLKIFLGSDGTTPCEIDEIKIEGQN